MLLMPDLSELVNQDSAPLSKGRRLYEWSRNYIDYKMGVVGAPLMGGIVWALNADEGAFHATTAALKQGTYTFLVGGSVMRLCQTLAQRGRSATLAVALAVLAPSAVTIGATYGVHMLKGTPKPRQSTIPTAVVSLPAFLYWGMRKRMEMDREATYHSEAQ